MEAVPKASRKEPTILERVFWKISLSSFKLLIGIFVFYNTKIAKRALYKKPTYTKYYPVRPKLINHIFIPERYKAGSAPLPLLIDIHGGGFCIGHPFIDDNDNSILCHDHGICVVSINYEKAPGSPFPGPVEDVAALIEAILDDPSLPVDKSKVAVLGYSAGGNLALTGTQLHGLEKRVKAVVAYYPVTDFKRTLSDREALTVPPPNRRDILISLSRAFNWAYIRRSDDLENPLLSPLFAERTKLPAKLFILGCEYDILCPEAREAAEKWAGSVERRPIGKDRTGWQAGDVTWEELKGLEHGYNQRWESERDLKVKEEWKKRTTEIHAQVAEWLFREVYA